MSTVRSRIPGRCANPSKHISGKAMLAAPIVLQPQQSRPSEQMKLRVVSTSHHTASQRSCYGHVAAAVLSPPSTCPSLGPPPNVTLLSRLLYLYTSPASLRRHPYALFPQDPKWSGVAWTVYRDEAYDLGPFLKEHPGGKCAESLSTPACPQFARSPSFKAARHVSLADRFLGSLRQT